MVEKATMKDNSLPTRTPRRRRMRDNSDPSSNSRMRMRDSSDRSGSARSKMMRDSSDRSSSTRSRMTRDSSERSSRSRMSVASNSTRSRSSLESSSSRSSRRMRKSSGENGSSSRSLSCKRRLSRNHERNMEIRRRAPKRTKSFEDASKPKRSVRFEVDANNQLSTHVREIGCDFSDEELSNLWYSETELADILNREQNVFEVFSNCCESYIDNVLNVWNGDMSQEEEAQEIAKIVKAPARGMEIDVVTTVGASNREKAIKCVLDTQRKMVGQDIEVKMNTMRRRYKVLSRTACKFAKSMADGDALIAEAILNC